MKETLVFDSNGIGVTMNSSPAAGQFVVKILSREGIGWFPSKPRRYRWDSARDMVVERVEWRTERDEEQVDKDRSFMKRAIKEKEEQKNARKIEHPNIAGSFFEPSCRINRVLSRCEGTANSDPLPVGRGTFDDINENPVPMTVRQLKNLRDAIVDREYANYLNRKDHIKSMMLQADPLTYDYSGGWS